MDCCMYDKMKQIRPDPDSSLPDSIEPHGQGLILVQEHGHLYLQAGLTQPQAQTEHQD